MQQPAAYFQHSTPSMILCCICGVSIPANPSNMCVNCIRGQVDITDGIPKNLQLQQCRTCARWLVPPTHWATAELESRELLTLCIKRIKGLNKVKLVDAGFVWTEPHSKRVKVKLTIQKEVFNGTILQQVFIVEYVIINQQCDKCQKFQAKDTWVAVVQVRQKVEHKRTFYFLEQLILKHNAHQQASNLKERPDGLDFFFNHRSHAQKLTDFLQQVVPVRYKTSEQLISYDEQNSAYNFKYTFSVELVPLCRDDLLCLPLKTSQAMGGFSPLVIVTKISNQIHVLDPLTLQGAELSPALYWKYPFHALSTQKYLIEYTVLDIQPLGPQRGKYMPAEVQVARNSDFGRNNTVFTTRTHIGHLLQPGDLAMGFDLVNGNYNDSDTASLRGRALPEVVLVRKGGVKRSKPKNRVWKLKHLNKEAEDDHDAAAASGGAAGGGGGRSNKRAAAAADPSREAQEYETFLRELEQDPEMRSKINLYKVPGAEQIIAEKMQKQRTQDPETMVDADGDEDDDDEDDPALGDVGLEELLDDLTIEEQPMGEAALEDE